MEKFKLPRKLKKSLQKTMWLYPEDEKGSSLMAWPAKSQEDFEAYKKGIVTKFPESNKAERKRDRAILDKEIYVEDNVLKNYVEDMIRKDLHFSFYNTLIEAKNTPRAKVAYFNFINAYHLYQNGKDSYANICCMSVDWANELLKNKR